MTTEGFTEPKTSIDANDLPAATIHRQIQASPEMAALLRYAQKCVAEARMINATISIDVRIYPTVPPNTGAAK